VSNVDANSSLADVDVISNVKIGKLQIPVNKLSYLAKGYIFGNPNAASAGTANTAPQTPSVVSAQNASQIALLYPAPCVVMAVPYNTSLYRLLFVIYRPRFVPRSHVCSNA